MKATDDVTVDVGDAASPVVIALPSAGTLVPRHARLALGMSDDGIRRSATRTPEAGLASVVRTVVYGIRPRATVITDAWSSLVPPPHEAFDDAVAQTLEAAAGSVVVEITVGADAADESPSPLLTLLPEARRSELRAAGVTVTQDGATHRLRLPRNLLGAATFESFDARVQRRAVELLRAPVAVAQVLPVLDAYEATAISTRSGAVPDRGIVITAWNPFSVETDLDDNSAAHERLSERLRDLGFAPQEVIAGTADWQEPSWWVADLERTVGCALGREFGQTAVFEVLDGRRRIVVCATDDVLETAGDVQR